jgi:hypothetical protein
MYRQWPTNQPSKKTEGVSRGREPTSTSDLKALNERSKQIKEQNEKLGNRIHQIIHT